MRANNVRMMWLSIRMRLDVHTSDGETPPVGVAGASVIGPDERVWHKAVATNVAIGTR